jgi:ParB family chromosome partitioning protein
MQLEILDISQIEVPEIRVTSNFPDEVLEQFRLSVATVGVLQPIHVLRDGSRMILVDGLHRIQEAAARGETTIRALVEDGSLRDALVQNLLTSGLKGKPKASELRRVIGVLGEEYGMDSIAIRRATGLSQDYIERLQWVNRAHAAVQRALDDEEISVSHAALIARIERHDVQERVLDACRQNRMSVQALRHHIELVEQILADPSSIRLAPEAPVQRLARCSGCKYEYPIEDLAMYSLCPHCQAQLYDEVRYSPGP